MPVHPPVQFNDHRIVPIAGTFRSLVDRRIIVWCHPILEARFINLAIRKVPKQMLLRTILTPPLFRPPDHFHEVLEQAKGKGCTFAGFWPLVWLAHHSAVFGAKDLLHFSELPLVAPDTEIEFHGEPAFPCLENGSAAGTFHIRLARKSMLGQAHPRFLVAEEAQRIGEEMPVPAAA